MSSFDPPAKRTSRLAAMALAACILALGLAAPAQAEDILFDWEIIPADYMGTGDPELQGTFLLRVSLWLGEGWNFEGIEIDQPANLLGEVLDYRPARYGYTHLEEASDGGFGGGIIGTFTALPGTHSGLFDRVFLPGGGSRPASIRIGASYYSSDPDYEGETSLFRTYEISLTVLSSVDFPAIVPEPASIASASLAVVAAGGLVARNLRRRARQAPAAAA